MKKISLTMIVKNEERCLERCLKSVAPHVDEMIVVDTGSTDNTKGIAKACGAKVYDYVWENDFAKARNYALSKASGDWHLVLDADEYITQIDRQHIESITANQGQIGCIKIVNEIHTEDGINYSKVYVPRLLPKGVWYTRSIHEQPDSQLPRVKVKLELYHDGYVDQEIKVKRNLAYLEEQIKRTPEDSYILYQLAYTLYLNEDYQKADSYFEKFYQHVSMQSSYRNAGIINYIENNIKLGKFKEGHALIEKEEFNLQHLSEFYFVCAAFYREYVLANVKENMQYLPFIEQCYLECLNIGENEEEDGAVGTGSYLAAYNLGVWYEVTKQLEQAVECYTLAENYNYAKAIERKKALLQG